MRKPDDRTRIVAPKQDYLQTPGEALYAFDMMTVARNSARKAHGDYARYTAGTATANRHYRNYETRDEIADQWAALVRNWLETTAMDSNPYSED